MYSQPKIEKYMTITSWVAVGMCALSLIGAAIIIWIFVRGPIPRKGFMTYLLHLTLANIGHVTGMIFGAMQFIVLSDNGTLCIIQDFMTIYFPVVSFLWTALIIIHCLFLTYEKTDIVCKHQKVLSLCCWILPVLGILISANWMWDVLGEDNDIYAGPWCWIKALSSRTSSFLWMFFTVIIWEILGLMAAILAFLSLVFRKLIHRSKRSESINLLPPSHGGNGDEGCTKSASFVYLWLILYILRLFGMIRFFLLWGDPRITAHWLMVLETIGDSGQAFANCLLLFMTDKRVRNWFFPCCMGAAST